MVQQSCLRLCFSITLKKRYEGVEDEGREAEVENDWRVTEKAKTEEAEEILQQGWRDDYESAKNTGLGKSERVNQLETPEHKFRKSA